MKYYIFDESTDDTQIGIYTQGHCIDEFNNSVEVEKKAKFTDLLSITNYNINYQMALSEKAISHFSKYWDTKNVKKELINFTNKMLNNKYYLISFDHGIESIINFKLSKFGVIKGINLLEIFEGIDSLDKFKLSKKEVFLGATKYPKFSHLMCIDLVLSVKPPAISVILSNSHFYIKEGILINQEVYDCIKANNLTGFAFKEIDIQVE